MDNTSSDFNRSVLIKSLEKDPLPINRYKLSDEEIFTTFPDVNEEELEKIKNDLITISEILYNNYEKE